MANPVVRGTQSAPGQFTGTIHFRGRCAYLENKDQSDWTLLQFDNPFTGIVNPAVAATTASRLRSTYNESDQVSFHGVLSDQSFDVVSLYVLFVF
ncbi:MAG TPA: hypothetical protein VNU92_17635 [Edaphobacter sp.]|jgi:hypothetical protein|nr:hypothetical protein [Edaphobacter sp.]